MGLFLSSIKEDARSLASGQHPWVQPLEKVKEYHGIFKSVCDSFLIRKQDFLQIFGSESKLEIWDRENSENIDALELFCGLAFFSSERSFKAKVSFLFAIFDFNQIKSISIVDLQYMILCVCNSTYKILGKNAKANELEVAQWLGKKLNPADRIKVTQLYRFCLSDPEVNEFFRFTGINIGVNTAKSPAVIQHGNKFNTHSLTQTPIEQSQLVNRLGWFHNLSLKITKGHREEKLKNYSCEIGWIYGIKFQGLRKPFLVVGKELLYSVGGMLIAYNQEQNTQRVYSRHVEDISAFCISMNGIVASSDGEGSAFIHFWDFNSMETNAIIEVLHKNKIAMMSFLWGDNLLATVGSRENSPILVYCAETYSLLYSLNLPFRVVDIAIFFSPISQFEQETCLRSAFACFSPSYLQLMMDLSAPLSPPYFYQDPISCCCLLQISSQNVYLRTFTQDLMLLAVTGHESGAIRSVVWGKSGWQGEEDIVKLDERITMLRATSVALIICFADQIRFYDLNILREEPKEDHVLRIIKLSDHPSLKLLATTIRYFDLAENQMLLCTSAGDLLALSDRALTYERPHFFEGEQVRRVNSMLQLGGPLKAMCFIEKEGISVILVVSEGKKICQINPQTHQTQTVWEVGGEDSIGVLDAANSDEGICYVVCGCKSGRLLIRLDWQECPKTYDCSAEVVEVKLSKDTSYLLVATADNYLLFFSQVNRTFSSPRKLHFENESPLSISFLDNYKFFSVSTSVKNVYLIQIPQLKHRNIQKESDRMSISKMQVSYPNSLDQVNKALRTSKGIVGGDMKYFLITLDGGQLLFFENMDSLALKSYKLLTIHKCSLGNLIISDNQSSFYSLGSTDNMLVQWNAFTEENPQIEEDRISSLEDGQGGKVDDFHIMRKLCQGRQNSTQKKGGFLFKGTRIDKLNENLHKNLRNTKQRQDQSLSSSMGQKLVSLSLRQGALTLRTTSIYGFNCTSLNTVMYSPSSSPSILYHTARFIIEQDLSTGKQTILEQTNTKISFFGVSNRGEIVLAEGEKRPRLLVQGGLEIQTTHQGGIMRIGLWGDYVLSCGVGQENGYSLNLHNLRTNQLLMERTTHIEINEFVMISAKEFVSIRDIYRWKNFIAGEKLGYATCALLMPNGSDIFLGGFQGQLSLLSSSGIYELVDRAHNKAVIAARLLHAGGQFELITAGEDQRIKIWSNTFEQKLCIDLALECVQNFRVLKEAEMMKGAQMRPSRLVVKSFDTRGDKILVGFAHGQVYELTLRQVERQKDIVDPESRTSFQTDSYDGKVLDEQQSLTQQDLFAYALERKKILDAHCCQSPTQSLPYVVFDMHSVLPLLVSAGNDGRLIFRDVETDRVICNYLCETQSERVRAVRFSTVGKMLVVGLKSGAVMSFLLDYSLDSLGKVQQLKLIYFQTFKHKGDGEIREMKFSKCSTYFSVSYLCAAGEESEGKQAERSFVKIFRVKSQKNQNSQEAFYECKDTVMLREDDKKSHKYAKCAVHLSFLEHACKPYLLFYEQYFDGALPFLEKQSRYSLYSISDCAYVNDQYSVDWSQGDFCQVIHSRTENSSELQSMTAMRKIGNHVVFGAASGKLHVVRQEALDIAEPISECKQQGMCLARTYCCHTSAVDQLLTSPCTIQNPTPMFLVSSSLTDQCLVKQRVQLEPTTCELDYCAYQLQIVDDHGEFLSRRQFYEIINNVQPLREEITDLLQDVQQQVERSVEFKVLKVIGRRARSRRNNLFFFDQQLIYSLGPNIVIQHVYSSCQQHLLPSTPNLTAHMPQISSFHYNGDHLILSTEEERARLFVWDIRSQSCLSWLKIDCAFIHVIKLGEGTIAALAGVNDKFQLTIQVVDWKRQIIIGTVNFPHSGNWKIKDLCMLPRKKFVTCGYQHLAQWEMRGDELVYHSFLGVPESRHFLVVRCASNYVITGCEKGHLYLWKNFQLVYTLENLHETAIRAMETNDGLIVTGGKDGWVCWGVIEEDIIKKCGKINLKHGQLERSVHQQAKNDAPAEKEEEGKSSRHDKSFEIKFQIQSIVFGEKIDNIWQVFCGTRSGDIFDIKVSSGGDVQNPQKAKQTLHGFNQEEVVGVSFSKSQQNKLYTLTKSGLIQIWSLLTMEQLFSYHLGKQSKKIYAVRNFIVVCCKFTVESFRLVEGDRFIPVREMCIESERHYYDDNDSSSNLGDRREEEEQVRGRSFGESKSFAEGRSFIEGEITAFCLSKNEKDIALSVYGNSSKNYINIYQFGSSKVLFNLTNLKHQIQYLDFSVDQKYVLFKDKFQQIGMIHLENYKRINTIFVQMKIEWEQQGLRISPKGQRIYYSYNCQNKIQTLCKLGDDRLVVGDQMGTLRIFEYPCPADRIGQLHLQCYKTHMNCINNIQVHPSLSFVVSTSVYDRALVIWAVQNHQKQ